MASGKQTRPEANQGHTERIVLFFGTLAILYFARGILIPLAFALILAFLLTPAVTWLSRIGIRRVPSVLVIVITVATAVGFAAWAIGNQLIEVANQLPGYRHNIDAKIASFQLPASGALGRATRSLKEIGEELAKTPGTETRPVPV